jgi:transposase
MTLVNWFHTLILQEVERASTSIGKGRPKRLEDAQALNAIFRVLKTGMQWREVETQVVHTTVW